jgi:glutamate-1-semialdehyde 2,1-aminomutase
MNRSNSHAIFSRAIELMPGGVNSAARAFGGVGGEPIVFDRAHGAYLIDVDENRYIDYIGSWGPMIFGHAFEPVVQAVSRAASKGTSFGAPTKAENVLAELIIASIPSVEMVRLVNSGTEATMSAIRLARGYTGREVIIKFSGNYHGHVDSLLVAAGSAAATLSVPNSPGVTAGTTKDTVIMQYNDAAGLREYFATTSQEVAAIILEPVCGNMGCVIPNADFLQALQQVTSQSGALLIIDEVMTGFRVALGGAQSLYGIDPDLTTMGKIVGGGLPLGAFGGRKEIMHHVLPAGKVFQAGTLSGNPIATAAGIATLQMLHDAPPYELLEQRSAQLETGLRAAATQAGVQFVMNRVGSMMTLFFNDLDAVTDWDSASKSDVARFAKFFWGLIERGVYFPCSQFEALFVSAAHSMEDIEHTIQAAGESLTEIASS